MDLEATMESPVGKYFKTLEKAYIDGDAAAITRIRPSNLQESRVKPVVLVRATRQKRYQHGEVGQRKQQLVGRSVGGLRSTGDEAQMAALREVTDMLKANPGKIRDFCVRENLLTRFDFYQGSLAKYSANFQSPSSALMPSAG
jgi:hypothetical protein